MKNSPEHTQQSSSASTLVPGPSGTGQASSAHSSGTSIVDQPYYGTFPPEPEDVPFDEERFTESEGSGSFSEPEEDLLLETTDKKQLTEDMIYRETVRSVRSFMGWNHVPPFESDFTEPDKSNNPWKGKNPKRARISVEMMLDD